MSRWNDEQRIANERQLGNVRVAIMSRTQALSSSPSAHVVPASADGSLRLVASRSFSIGESILTVDGVIQSVPSRYSIQIGIDQHVEQPSATTRDQERLRYPWRFLNHACAPNASLHGRDLRALRAIDEGEEITFDYLTTEFEMATPFRCACGASSCQGEIRGFRHLSAEQRARYVPRTAAHVLALARRHGLI